MNTKKLDKVRSQYLQIYFLMKYKAYKNKDIVIYDTILTFFAIEIQTKGNLNIKTLIDSIFIYLCSNNVVQSMVAITK